MANDGVCVAKLTGRDLVFFFSESGGSQLFVCIISLWVCEFILFEGIFLYTIRYYCMVWVCICEWTCKTHSRLFFSSPKGLSGFRFHLFKKFVSIVFPSYNYLLCFIFSSLLSARTLIKHTLSAWKLSTLLFITQWSLRHHLYYCV